MSDSLLKPRQLYALRQACRWMVLLCAIVLAWPARWGPSSSVILPALSPFIALASAISTRALGVLALLAVPVLLLVLLFHRWFCRYGCPVGLLQELVARARPGARRSWPRCPALGQWLALATLGGALVGYPLFLWLDPLAIFNGFSNAWRHPIALASLLTGLALPLLLLLELAAPALWCQRLCPLGATQDVLARPRNYLRKSRRRSDPMPQNDAIQGNPATPPTPPAYPPRRWLLAAFAGALGAMALQKTKTARRDPLPLRPPGALDDPSFTGVCVRCGNCAQVCPSHIIQPDFASTRWEGLLAPRLSFDRDYCREDCHRCNQVCPSGALARLPLQQKNRHIIGTATVYLDSCLLVQGRECTACIRQCPYQAIAMESTDGGFSNQPFVVLNRCNGCGACQSVCPTRPNRSIRVHPQSLL